MESSLEHSTELLHQVGIFLQSLTPDQVDDIVSGRSRITLSKRRGTSTAKAHDDSQPVIDYEALGNELSSKASREEGYSLLDDAGLNRSNLQKLARTLDIPVLKSDNMERIRDRVIEATIGYRLRSGAIRGDEATDMFE
jgi:hypothetical protein